MHVKVCKCKFNEILSNYMSMEMVRNDVLKNKPFWRRSMIGDCPSSFPPPDYATVEKIEGR